MTRVIEANELIEALARAYELRLRIQGHDWVVAVSDDLAVAAHDLSAALLELTAQLLTHARSDTERPPPPAPAPNGEQVECVALPALCGRLQREGPLPLDFVAPSDRCQRCDSSDIDTTTHPCVQCRACGRVWAASELP